MSRLNKVLDKWNDLESSYRKECSKNTKELLTKREYLCRLLNFKPQNDSPELLKSLLKEESSSYTAADYEQYESLLEVLDYTYKKLLSFDGEIVNLQQFVFGDNMAAIQLDDFSVYDTSANLVSIKQALQDGYVTECVVQKADGIHSYVLGHEQTGYIAFRNLLEVVEFLHRPAEELEQSCFLSQVYYILGNCIIKKKFSAPMVFLDKSLFEEKGNTITAGSLSFSVTKRNLTEASEVGITIFNGERLHLGRVSYYSKQMTEPFSNTRLIFVR